MFTALARESTDDIFAAMNLSGWSMDCPLFIRALNKLCDVHGSIGVLQLLIAAEGASSPYRFPPEDTAHQMAYKCGILLQIFEGDHDENDDPNKPDPEVAQLSSELRVLLDNLASAALPHDQI